VLGFDLLVDKDLKAWLLEVNDHPSLYIYLEKDYMGGGVEKILSEVDLLVKKTAIGDALSIVKKTKSKINELQKCKSYERIHSTTQQDDLSLTVQRLRQLYCDLTPIKKKQIMSSGSFERLLIKNKFIAEAQKQGKVGRSDLTYLFQ